MKTIHSILIKASLFALVARSAVALSLPVAEDTFSTSRGTLTLANGKAATLLLNTNQAALLKFDLSSIPPAFTPTNIASARLKIYIVNARAPGDLVASLITSDWTEAVLISTPMPSVDTTTIGSVPAGKVLGKHFVSFDVTAAVVAALDGIGPNFGFLLKDSTGQTHIASKEGPGQGPAAELEIEANLAQDGVGNGAFSGSLGVGGDFYLGGLFRQGSETGTGSPAGRGIITRRLQSTNSALGSIVARTDTLTLERDGTLSGLRIVNTANPGSNVVVAVIGVDGNGSPVGRMIFLSNPSSPGTNALIADGVSGYFRCSFGDASALGHQTEVSLVRTAVDAKATWTGFLTSTYNQ